MGGRDRLTSAFARRIERCDKALREICRRHVGPSGWMDREAFLAFRADVRREVDLSATFLFTHDLCAQLVDDLRVEVFDRFRVRGVGYGDGIL